MPDELEYQVNWMSINVRTVKDATSLEYSATIKNNYILHSNFIYKYICIIYVYVLKGFSLSTKVKSQHVI